MGFPDHLGQETHAQSGLLPDFPMSGTYALSNVCIQPTTDQSEVRSKS